MTPLATDAEQRLVDLDLFADSLDVMSAHLADLAARLDAEHAAADVADAARIAEGLALEAHLRAAQLRVKRHELAHNALLGGRS